MAVQNSVAKATKKAPKFSVAIQSDGYQRLINQTLGDPNRAKRFVAAISSAVATNPALQECDAGSILSGALLGESLNLSPSPQLGQYYLVPFNDRKTGIKKATFILGYKGYIQLALRSGQYADLDVGEVRQGEYLGRDKRTGKETFAFYEDNDFRETLPVVGYYARLEYLNGFTKLLYWSKSKMEDHADKYSAAFSIKMYEKLQKGLIPEKELWKYSSYWYKDFDGMAYKTMLRQLISKWGIMSPDMQDALSHDSAVLKLDGEVDFVTESDEVPATDASTGEVIDLQKDPEVLEKYEEEVGDPLGFFGK